IIFIESDLAMIQWTFGEGRSKKARKKAELCQVMSRLGRLGRRNLVKNKAPFGALFCVIHEPKREVWSRWRLTLSWLAGPGCPHATDGSALHTPAGRRARTAAWSCS